MRRFKVFRGIAIAAVVGLALVAASCADRVAQAPEPEPEPISVANSALGIRIAQVPPGLAVAVNEESQLVLTTSDDASSGQLSVEVGPPEDGVNLVAAVNDHQRQIEAAAEGQFSGGAELVSHLGVAFRSRGQFLDLEAGAMLEEACVFVIHPGASRLLTLRYRYPAAQDSAARVDQLLAVFAEIESTSVPTE